MYLCMYVCMYVCTKLYYETRVALVDMNRKMAESLYHKNYPKSNNKNDGTRGGTVLESKSTHLHETMSKYKATLGYSSLEIMI